jgi:hypothetical protein
MRPEEWTGERILRKIRHYSGISLPWCELVPPRPTIGHPDLRPLYRRVVNKPYMQADAESQAESPWVFFIAELDRQHRR